MRYGERAYVGCGGKTIEGGHSRLQCLCSLETSVSIIFLPLAGAHLLATLLLGIFLAYSVFLASSLSACGYLR